MKLYLREKKSLDREKFFFLQLEKSTLFHFLLKKKNRQQNKISLKENVLKKFVQAVFKKKCWLEGGGSFLDLSCFASETRFRERAARNRQNWVSFFVLGDFHKCCKTNQPCD